MAKKGDYTLKINNSSAVSPISLAGLYREYYSIDVLYPEDYIYSGRYSTTDRIDDRGEIYHEIYNINDIPESSDDVYIKVDKSLENRIDKISYKYYKNTVYWWLIAIANNIVDPLNIPVGMILRIPPQTVILDLERLNNG